MKRTSYTKQVDPSNLRTLVHTVVLHADTVFKTKKLTPSIPEVCATDESVRDFSSLKRFIFAEVCIPPQGKFWATKGQLPFLNSSFKTPCGSLRC